ncbi:MAG: dihydrolipoamide acetyltransferase [Gammaproteobacteria bacterium]|nr:dihydrolipoamide acetyltransferase [Gammaproteobacteria bacterium]
MPKEIYLVKVGMSMTEGMVSEWFIPDGGTVKKGELVYSLETEKVNLDVDAEYDGVVKHLVEVGITLKPGDVVGYIFESGEDVPDNLDQADSQTIPSEQKEPEPVVQSEASVPELVREGASNIEESGRVKSSPAARRLAQELGVDYRAARGTGPGGRIVEIDVRALADAGGRESGRTEISVQQPNLKASPLARKIAEERGIDLASIKGTGPGGRIVQSDVEQAPLDRNSVSSPTGLTAELTPGPHPGDTVPVKGMRKTIATRMHQSLMESAQLSMDMEVIMNDAVKMRNGLVEEWASEGVKPTYTDFVIKACAKALKSHPMMNSRFSFEEILLLEEVHVGMAVALPEGLVVPVVRNADRLSIKELAKETSRLAKAAREGSLSLDDYAGGTFTVSALGMYGVDSFTPIINHPQSGIMGINRLYDGMEWEDERIVKSKKMNLSLTWDHRALDGAPAAEYLVEVKKLLEAPYRLLI